MSLGVPVMACPNKNHEFVVPSGQEGRRERGAFSESVEPVHAIIDNTWTLRPDGIIHLGSMELQETDLPAMLAIDLMKSVSVSSLMAKTLDVPFVYVTPGGLGDTPSTLKGAQGMILEDLVKVGQQILQVNGVFGPNIENQVKRWVYSEKLTVDDTRLVNPVFESVLKEHICEYATRAPMTFEPSVITVGGPQTTWYEFFVNAGLTKALPWTDPLSHSRHRELRWEWTYGPLTSHARASLYKWYSTVNEST